MSETQSNEVNAVFWAMRAVTAEILRTVAGNGRSNEIPVLMTEAMLALDAYRDKSGYGISTGLMRLALNPEINPAAPAAAPASYVASRLAEVEQQDSARRPHARREEEWRRAERTMHTGALREVASMLVGQNAQARAGNSLMHDGLRDIEEMRRENSAKITVTR
jgi:hypothetical protein